jgi:hypothetical protein
VSLLLPQRVGIRHAQGYRAALISRGTSASILRCSRALQERYIRMLYNGLPLDYSPLRITNGFSVKLLAFNLWVHHGDAMQVGQRNPLGTVPFTGIDFAAHRQTGVVALL